MIAERVKAVVAEQFDVEEDDITNDLSFAELGADTFDLEEFVEALAGEFEIEIPPEYAESIETVGDAVNCVKKLLRGGG